jgi:hypothetical protein
MITWASILANLSKIGPALEKAWKWYKRSLKNDSFALVVGILFLLSLAGNGWLVLTSPKESAEVPTIQYINGTPVTITKPVTIKVYPGWIPVVEPGGNLNVHKVGFRFIPKAGLSYSGEFQPVAGARWFVFHRFGLETLTSRDKILIGPDFALGYLHNVTVSAGVCQKWNNILLSQNPSFYCSIGVCLR